MSGLDVPSFIHKISWAEKHLEKLECAMRKFGDSHPYRTCEFTEDKNKVRWVLEFSEDPDPEWSLIVGDFIYNVRSGLDHLAAALNPSAVRSNCMFPIVRQEVWNIPPAQGEDQERAGLRDKWRVSTRHMDPKAVAIIQSLQPTDTHRQETEFHLLEVLNRLSNKDKHQRLLSHELGLVRPSTSFEYADGFVYDIPPLDLPTPGNKAGRTALQNKATLELPPASMTGGRGPNLIVDVEIKGAVTQAIEMTEDGRYVIVPDHLRSLLEMVRNRIVVPLTPYLHNPCGKR